MFLYSCRKLRACHGGKVKRSPHNHRMWISNLSPQSLRSLAVALWLLGLALPTLRLPDGSTVPGVSVFVSGWLWLPMVLVWLPASAIAVASLLSNLQFLPVVWRLLRRPPESCTAPRWALAIALAANIAVAMPWSGAPFKGLSLESLHTLPGYYYWLLSFVVLGYATLQESPLPIQWLNGLLRRLGLMALIAAATFALGLTALLFMARA
jgi:hypothetical protein